jgi:hypothetical protein
VKIRPLEAQFGELTVRRLRAIQRSATELGERRIVPRYVGVEITKCLEAGLLLAAVQVSCSAWEYVVRRALVCARAARPSAEPAQPGSQRALFAEAEEDRRLTLIPMVKQLVQHGVLTEDEACVMQDLYLRVRIPLHHGIVGRYIQERAGTTIGELSGMPDALDGHGFEEQLESNAVNELEGIFEQVAILCGRHAV